MKTTVVYKELVTIDGVDYVISNIDFSESVTELIHDDLIESDDSSILDHVKDSITNIN